MMIHCISYMPSMRAERLFLAVPRGCLQFVIVVFPDHTHLLFLRYGSGQTMPKFCQGITNPSGGSQRC